VELERATTLAEVYTEVDALLAPFECDGTAECCTFSNTNREPYPTAIELAEVQRAIAAKGGARAVMGAKKHLPLLRRCPLLTKEGKCSIYTSRPFGCRTYFCHRVRGPGKLPRERLRELGARIADLSEKAFPHDPGPRPLSNALPSTLVRH
jgi:Fe-S-cluster containining protein